MRLSCLHWETCVVNWSWTLAGGDGVLSCLMVQRGGRAVRLDTAQKALGFARAESVRRGVEAQTAAAYACAMPFLSGAFDAAVCSDVIEHVRPGGPMFGKALRVTLEAMTAGRALVGTRVGGTPELIEDGVNGRLVERGNPAALARAIADLLLDDGLRARMGQASRELVQTRFAPEATLERLVNFYHQAIARREEQRG